MGSLEHRKKMSEIAKERGLGKHIRTKAIKKKMYTPERAEKLSRALKNNNNSKGKTHKNARGFYIDKGYKRVGNEGIPEHRLVWEKEMGSIPEGNQVHHINGNRLDNNINNLVCISCSEHTKLHWKQGDIR